MGPRSIVQSIKEATNAAKHLYPKYADSCQPALDILPHHNGWKSLRDERIGGFLAHCPSLTPEEITHRRLASILHPVQKAARLHFETSYPQLLDDHINYMEQIKHLIMSNATRRSEFSTAIACDANAERFIIDRFSTTDAITAPYQKMELEKDRREYRHAPVLNPVSRELEEERSVILGCDPMQKSDNVAEEVIIACLERYRSLYWQSPPSKYAAIASWKHCWGFIHMMETGYGVRETLLGVSRWEQVGQLIRLLVVNTHLSSRPFLNLTDQRTANNAVERGLLE
ncbi:hypothetical protein FRC15_000834 [Serendipita sp. 397]|nr:hypothetical protein FRC15_000834 [Serendipita sp. 397]